jgi:branched-chain amino acid transport system permease protein
MALFFVQTLLNGFTIGALYVLMALGFTLIFGILRIVNFAHGEFYMLGAFLVYMLFGVWKIVGYLPAVVISAVSIGLLGMVFERTVFPPYVGTLEWKQFVFPYDRVIVVGYTLLILIAFYYLLKRTKVGLAMEAVVQDKEAAQIQGIRVNHIYLVSFGIATLLAGAAGGLVGPIFALTPYIGGMPLMRAFMAVILGGMGNITGAVVGGLVIGVSESFLTTYFGGAFSAIMTFIVIMIILMIKPSGLFGEVGS